MRSRILFFIALCWMAAFLHGQDMGLKENKEFSELGDYVRQAQFSPFRNYFVYTLGNNTLRILDRDWNLLFEHHGNPKSVGGVFAFSPDGKYLAYGRYKGNNDIAMIRLEDQEVMDVLVRHSSYISHLEFSHDGNILVSCSSDKSAIIWEREGEAFVFASRLEGFDNRVTSSSFSYDDRFLVTGDDRGNIRVLETKRGSYKVFQSMQYRKHSVESVVFHPGRYEFVTGSLYGIRRYVLRKNDFVLQDTLEEHANVNHPLSFSPGGRYLAVPNYRELRIFRDDKKTFHAVDAVFRHYENLFGATFSEDGHFLTTFGADQKIIIWEIDHIEPSRKTQVSGWIRGDLSSAQRKVLNPDITGRIIASVDPKLTLPRDEFEKTIHYRERMERLSDWTLMLLQREMESYFSIRERGEEVIIPLQSLVGYNADLEIYKIRFMETEAGVSIPVPAARSLKTHADDALIAARKERSAGSSYLYTDFKLLHPETEIRYPVTPVENPFLPLGEEVAAGKSERSVHPAGHPLEEGGGTTYALLVATNVYDFFTDLVNPVLDARTISTELSENYGVVSELVVNPTLEETAAKIREYASRSYGEQDNLLVFFAGHGVYDEVFREGYVISRDSRQNDRGKTSYLSHSNLRTMINNVRCPHIFLVMDVCFGGTFDPHLASTHRGSGMYADISTGEYVRRKMQYTTRLYLTSGGKEYVPDGRPGFHSPFARRFIESLRHYGGEDGVLTTAEILQFVEKTDPQPRFGEFGDNEPGSDFILVLRK